jgi:hypothetical protein
MSFAFLFLYRIVTRQYPASFADPTYSRIITYRKYVALRGLGDSETTIMRLCHDAYDYMTGNQRAMLKATAFNWKQSVVVRS